MSKSKYPDGTRWKCARGSIFEYRDGAVYLISAIGPIKQFDGTLDIIDCDPKTFARIDPPGAVPVPDHAETIRLLAAEVVAWRDGDAKCTHRCGCQDHARKIEHDTDAILAALGTDLAKLAKGGEKS